MTQELQPVTVDWSADCNWSIYRTNCLLFLIAYNPNLLAYFMEQNFLEKLTGPQLVKK